MKLSRAGLLFLLSICISNCIFTIGDGYKEAVRKYSDLSDFKTNKIYLSVSDEYSRQVEEIKSKSGSIERITRLPLPESYMIIRDAVYYELRGKYKLDVELGPPQGKNPYSIVLTPMKPRFETSVSKVTVVMNRDKDPTYKLEITNEGWFTLIVIVPFFNRPKTYDQLGEIIAENIYKSISEKPAN
ncbi:hypothetical protein [Leptospira saintgironsiae]|uniref:Uncharacterized protein n=1 Tax=Leptospira saintgironsiae TaxID=2023183 RepID=A0A2M9Y841_9LEPT|nr:hypothetical protein [Leptospira saintgironsiae]PJZ47724.1 hypothetical protein CH362_17525 [Leptospira saintgironsiae]